jgi:hypothetical protein
MPNPIFPFTWQYNNQPIEVLASNVNLLLPECNDADKYITNVSAAVAPWVIYPTLINTCSKVEDLNTIQPNLPVQNLSGWKIGGHVVLQAQPSYSVSLGILTVENSFGGTMLNVGLYPWKSSGMTWAQIPGGYKIITEPLGIFNTASDVGVPSGNNYVQVKFTYEPVVYPPSGTTLDYQLMLYVDRCSISETPALPTDEIEIAISFELEFLIDTGCTVLYSGI